MDKDRTGAISGLQCSELDDPRSFRPRSGFVDAFRERGAADDLVEIGHDLTKLRRTDLNMVDGVSLFQQPYMQFVQHHHDRDYPLRPRIDLPAAVIPDRPFSELLRSRRSCRTFGKRPLALAEVGALLYAAIGETARVVLATDDGSVEVSFRSIASGGALHPTHMFVAVLKEGEPAPGIYHYDVAAHALERVKRLAAPDIKALFAAFPIHPFVVDLERASAICFVTTKFWRSRAKYGPRGYRYCLQEAGAACQNLNLAAVSLGLAHVVLGGFYDDEVHACLELDGVDHAVVTAIAVGTAPRQQEVEAHHGGL
jgi:SagB-type dehydrogenase family enzyme